MSEVDSSTSWKNMSSATKSSVVIGGLIAVALVVWLNFIR
jgi:hypothetical protein